MKVWKDRTGKWLTLREFLSRFKQGVEGITPLQQTRTIMWSMVPIFAGVIWGIVITLFSKTYWLSVILAASLPITTMQFISIIQRYWRFKLIENNLKGG